MDKKKAEDILGTVEHRNEIKGDMFRVIESVDDGTFRGAIIITVDPETKKLTMKVWGDKGVVNQAALRLLENAGVISDLRRPQAKLDS